MKGIRMTLDTKVNKNYVEDWRKVGWYDKASDSITGTVTTATWATPVNYLCSTFGKIGDLVTISFDCYGPCRVGGWDLRKESFVRCEGSGDFRYIDDCGTVQFDSPGKYHRVWVTYKLTQGDGPSFFIAVAHMGGTGTVHIRNIKVELSDHPTDYVDYQGGGNP